MQANREQAGPQRFFKKINNIYNYKDDYFYKQINNQICFKSMVILSFDCFLIIMVCLIIKKYSLNYDKILISIRVYDYEGC